MLFADSTSAASKLKAIGGRVGCIKLSEPFRNDKENFCNIRQAMELLIKMSTPSKMTEYHSNKKKNTICLLFKQHFQKVKRSKRQSQQNINVTHIRLNY